MPHVQSALLPHQSTGRGNVHVGGASRSPPHAPLCVSFGQCTPATPTDTVLGWLASTTMKCIMLSIMDYGHLRHTWTSSREMPD